MIVTCPACSTRYSVDPRALGSTGRIVRCASCTNTWHQAPPEDMPRPVDLRPADPSPMHVGARMQLPAAPKRRRVTWVGLGWVALILVLVLGGVGAVLARDQVVAQWPPAARLYAMVGMPVTMPGDGLKLTKITPSRGTEDGQPALIIEGEVTNVSNVALDVPKLRATLRDSNERELQSWTFSATESRLLPGASVPFRSSVVNPSEAATGVVVTFAGGS